MDFVPDPAVLSKVRPENFEETALAIFRYQSRENAVYREFLANLGKDPAGINRIRDIPFLPTEIYKTQTVLCAEMLPPLYFESSGTRGTVPGRHYVRDPAYYDFSILQAFRQFYGDPSLYCILALLPSYLERGNSSLIYMCQKLMDSSGHPKNGFYLQDTEALIQILLDNESRGQASLLIGVSFALLDLSTDYSIPLRHSILMETGGMKGRGPEITRQELHAKLRGAFGVESVHSEYGMTELLSMAYARAGGLFECPPWMRITVRDAEDPFCMLEPGHTGCLNIIDLANVHSCSFLATQDIGKMHADGRFEVLGRTDLSDVRGCNLLVAE